MSDDIREKVAGILRRSGVLIPNDYTPIWAHGRKIDELAAELADAAIAAHMEALGAGGYVVVKLPEPDEREDTDQEFTDFPGTGLYVPVVFDRHPGEVQIRAGAWCDEPLSVSEARELAASILAAAAKAEES